MENYIKENTFFFFFYHEDKTTEQVCPERVGRPDGEQPWASRCSWPCSGQGSWTRYLQRCPQTHYLHEYTDIMAVELRVQFHLLSLFRRFHGARAVMHQMLEYVRAFLSALDRCKNIGILKWFHISIETKQNKNVLYTFIKLSFNCWDKVDYIQRNCEFSFISDKI